MAFSFLVDVYQLQAYSEPTNPPAPQWRYRTKVLSTIAEATPQ